MRDEEVNHEDKEYQKKAKARGGNTKQSVSLDSLEEVSGEEMKNKGKKKVVEKRAKQTLRR